MSGGGGGRVPLRVRVSVCLSVPRGRGGWISCCCYYCSFSFSNRAEMGEGLGIYVWKRTRTAASGEKINDVFKVAGENNIGIRGVTIVVICALRNETKSKPRVVGVECPGRPVR